MYSIVSFSWRLSCQTDSIMFKFVKSVIKLLIPSWILRWRLRKDLKEVFPSGRAVPSDQGIYKTCTRHALGKAIVDGFQNRIYDSREIGNGNN